MGTESLVKCGSFRIPAGQIIFALPLCAYTVRPDLLVCQEFPMAQEGKNLDHQTRTTHL